MRKVYVQSAFRMADEDIDYNDESVGYMIGLLNELTEKA